MMMMIIIIIHKFSNFYTLYNRSIKYNRKIDVKNLSKQSDYDKRYQLFI